MKLAFVTVGDPNDPGQWSGIPWHMAAAFERQGMEVHRVGPLGQRRSWWFTAKHCFYRGVMRVSYARDREPAILEGYAQQVAEAVEQIRPDVVFSTGSTAIAHLQCPQPIVTWTDAVFAGMHGFYWRKLAKESLRKADAQERRAMKNVSLALFASDWAARGAIEHYDADPKNVHVVPFGANFATRRTLEQTRPLIEARPGDCCRLLLIGVDWARKGADMALAVAKDLNARGLPTELTIVGCQAPAGASMPPWARVLGFISKSTPDGRAKMEELLGQSHFMILPSRAEAFGIVFCEASSFGVPSLATRVGGIPSAVRDGVNGQTFALDAPAEVWSDFVLRTMGRESSNGAPGMSRYRDLAFSAFSEYENRLNWDTSAATVRGLLEQILTRENSPTRA